VAQVSLERVQIELFKARKVYCGRYLRFGMRIAIIFVTKLSDYLVVVSSRSCAKVVDRVPKVHPLVQRMLRMQKVCENWSHHL
jgi:hypothetical protein